MGGEVRVGSSVTISKNFSEWRGSRQTDWLSHKLCEGLQLLQMF